MHARRPDFNDLVARALQREVATRRELRPHAQLAIAPDAPPNLVEEAYQRVRARYDAAAFAEYGPTAVEAAQTISQLLRDAYEAMRQPKRVDGSELQPQPKLPQLKPRADETCRALQTLRGAIERRLNEALAHRAAGRAEDAIRVFESVLVLDRHNLIAREAIRELRAKPQPPEPSWSFSRWFRRLFGGATSGDAPKAVAGG